MIYFVAFLNPSMQRQVCCFTSLSFTDFRHLLPNLMTGKFLFHIAWVKNVVNLSRESFG